MNAAPLLELMESYPEGVPVDVCHSFEKLALEVRASGFERYSADAVLCVRWHEHVERQNRAFRANNNWTAALARRFLKTHPEAAGFFELRERADQ
jgi:hypothetical protein